MNDFDLVREVRADAPEPSADQLTAGRRRLQTVIGSGAAPARPRPTLMRHPVLLAGGLALTAAAAVVAVSVGGSGQDGHVGPQPSAVRLAAATEVLNKAARTVETRSAPDPQPHQWLYWKTFEYRHGSGRTASEMWQRFDGSQDATVLRNGKLVISENRAATANRLDPGTPLGAYRLLAGLPTDPQAMLSTLYTKVGSEPRGGGQSRDELAFENIQQLLWNSPLGAPPRVQAALYRALAKIPGVKVRMRVEYAPGRTAIGVYHTSRAALLLDPTTYRMIGWVNVSDGTRPPAPKGATDDPKRYSWNSPVLPAGTVIYSMTRSAITSVSGPGQH